MQRLNIRGRPTPVQGVRTHGIRCEFEGRVGLAVFFDVLLNPLPDHVVHGGHREEASEVLARTVQQSGKQSDLIEPEW